MDFVTRLAGMCYFSDPLSPWKGLISSLDQTQCLIGCRCTLLAGNSSIRLSGSEEQIKFSQQSPKMLKWLFCFFFFNVGLFLNNLILFTIRDEG